MRKCSFNGSLTASASNAFNTRSLISPAAALVNVTTNSLSMSTGSLPYLPSTIEIILSTKTAVFPEPAAADTRRLQSLVFITLLCSSVHLVPDILVLLSFLWCLYHIPLLIYILQISSRQASIFIVKLLVIKGTNSTIFAISTWC